MAPIIAVPIIINPWTVGGHFVNRSSSTNPTMIINFSHHHYFHDHDHDHHVVDKSEIMCKFWALGYCGKGVKCSYLHSRSGITSPTHDHKVIPVNWSPPPWGWIKINTDGAVSGSSGASSCGGVFRDSRGAVLGAFSSFLGTDSTPLEAEMHGVRIAIDVARSKGLRKVWLESDSTRVVEMVKNSGEDVPPKLRAEWCETLKTINSMECFHVSHTFREGNTVADKLASHGIESRDVLTVWDGGSPDFVVREAHLDASGHTYFRDVL